jgi:Holliday junction resolvase-like predicted endonuclease
VAERGTRRQPTFRRPPTIRRRHGDRAEALVARHLAALGWSVLARQVRVGRDEIDLLCLDAGPPRTIVLVEVRSHASSRFGPPEESVDRRKVLRLYRAGAALRRLGTLPDGQPLPRLLWRIDLLAVDDAPTLAPGVGGPVIRHVRGLRPD